MVNRKNFTHTQSLGRVELLPELVDPEEAECIYNEAVLLSVKRIGQCANNGNTNPREGIKLGRCATARALNLRPVSEKHIAEIRGFAKEEHHIPADTLDVAVIGPESRITPRYAQVASSMVINCIENSVLTVRDLISKENYTDVDLRPGDAYIVHNPMWSEQRPQITVTNMSPSQYNTYVTLR